VLQKIFIITQRLIELQAFGCLIYHFECLVKVDTNLVLVQCHHRIDGTGSNGLPPVLKFMLLIQSCAYVNPEWLLMPKQISILKIGKLRSLFRVNRLPFVFGDHYIVHSGKKQLSIGAQIPIEHVLPECIMIPNHCTKKKNRWF
jgi:hypothetical protein